MQLQFKAFFSVDSAKAIKAQEYGWLNAINYMAPHKSSGIAKGADFINLCSHASIGCIALCLGEHSGQAAMISKATGTNNVRESRKRKAHYFMKQRAAFLNECALHVARQFIKAAKLGFKLCVRLNGATDIVWESMSFIMTDEAAKLINKALKGLHTIRAGIHRSIYHAFPFIQFVDYTKNHTRFDRALPDNLHLTFSRAEDNEAKAIELLGRGINVAIVFGGPMPESWNGFPVIDGDTHDLRHLDPKGGFVVGLTPKGNKAKKDQSGFVLRNYAESLALAA